MRIHHLNILQFGKLKNIEFQFQKGVHLIEGENEAGKTTLQRCFLWLFYGAVTIKDYGLNLREFALPQGETYAAAQIELSHEDTRIIIERRTGFSRKDDVLRIYEKSTQNQLYYPDPLGKTFFGLSVLEFIKTLFMGQEQVPLFQSKQDSLFLKLSNLLESGEEEVSYRKASEELDRQIKVLSSGKTGLIPELQKELRSLYLELEASKKMHAQKEDLLQELENLDRLQEVQVKQRALLHELKGKAKLFHNRSDLMNLKTALDELNELKKAKEKNWMELSSEETTEIREKIELLEEAKLKHQEMMAEYHMNQRELEKYSSIKEDENLLEALNTEVLMSLHQEEQEEKSLLERLAFLQAEYEEGPSFGDREKEVRHLLRKYERQLRGLKKKRFQFVLSTGLLIFMLLLHLMRPSSLTLGALLFLLPVFFFYLPPLQRSLRARLLQKTKGTEEKIERISADLGLHPTELLKSKKHLDPQKSSQEINRMKMQRETLQDRRSYYYRLSGTSSLPEMAKKIEEIRKQVTVYRERLVKKSLLKETLTFQSEKLELLKKDLYHRLLPLGFSEEDDLLGDFWERYELSRIRMAHLKEKELQLHLSVKGLLGEMSLEEALDEVSTYEALALQEDLTEEVLIEKEAQLHQEEEAAGIRKKELMEKEEKLQYRDPYFLEDYLKAKHLKEKTLQKKLAVLLATRDLLIEAEKLVKKQYVETLGDEVSRTFSLITGKNRAVFVEDLDTMKVEEETALLHDQQLSRGAWIQLYFSLRLTMVKRIFKDTAVPLFLDEVFSSFDDRRTQNALNLLLDEFSEHQIFIFSSHSREGALLGQQSLKIVLP